jgi:hypothetical protein
VASALQHAHVCAEVTTPEYRKVGISMFVFIELEVTGLLPIVFNDSALADQMYPGFWCSLDAHEKKIAYS